MLVFPLTELPEMTRGKGVRLQKLQGRRHLRPQDLRRRRRPDLDRHLGPHLHQAHGRTHRLARRPRPGRPPAAERLPAQQQVRAEMIRHCVFVKFRPTSSPSARRSTRLGAQHKLDGLVARFRPNVSPRAGRACRRLHHGLRDAAARDAYLVHPPIRPPEQLVAALEGGSTA